MYAHFLTHLLLYFFYYFYFFLSGSCTIENLGSLTPLSDTWDMLLPVGFRYEKKNFFFFLSISWNCSLHFNICVKTKIVTSVDKCQSNCFVSSYCVITFTIEILKDIFSLFSDSLYFGLQFYPCLLEHQACKSSLCVYMPYYSCEASVPKGVN